jgi:phospholipid/cholesterol/gamma-HCH transport system substrate-binding protein
MGSWLGSRRMGRSALSTLLVGALAAGLLAGCGGGGDHLTVTAVFDDVADLADGAPVQLADVGIGQVHSIHLDDSGSRAQVEMRIDRSAGVPAAVTARVRRTSPLGEKFIELRPDNASAAAPELLEDGATIANTEVVPDLEQLVGSGTAFFGALGAGELSVLLEETAEGFGGQGQNIRAVLDNLGGVAEGFAAHTDELETLITSIDQLAADTGPAAEQHADALTNLAAATDLLDDDSEQLLDLMDSLAALATTGGSILREHIDEIENQIDALRSVSRAVATEQESFGALLENAQHHNEALRLGVRDFFAQVLNDFIICGLPGGGDQPGNALNSCNGS